MPVLALAAGVPYIEGPIYDEPGIWTSVDAWRR